MLIGKIIGFFFWLLGLFVFLSDYIQSKRCTVEADAVIADVIEEVRHSRRTHGSGRHTYYYPVIEFSTPDKTIRIRANFKAVHPAAFKRGKHIAIQYNPRNPHELKLREKSLWEGVIGMVILCALGTLIMYVTR